MRSESGAEWLIVAVSRDTTNPWVITRRGLQYQRLDLEQIAKTHLVNGPPLIEALVGKVKSSPSQGALVRDGEHYAVVVTTRPLVLHTIGKGSRERHSRSWPGDRDPDPAFCRNHPGCVLLLAPAGSAGASWRCGHDAGQYPAGLLECCMPVSGQWPWGR